MAAFDVSPQSPPSPIRRCKNIVICCDGTGNEFGERNSNVVKLYTALVVDSSQVAYYHPGVGTMGAPAARSHIAKAWSKVEGLAFGAGFRANVLDAYRYIMETYNDGDHLYLFGFSRGAYTVRALAGLLHGYGLLCRGNEGHLPYAWRAYTHQIETIKRRNLDRSKADQETTVEPSQTFKDTFSHHNFNIHFLGLWDTVSSIGWITEPLELLHVATNPTVCIGRHAISLDERRCFFQDNLWGKPLPHQDVLQVWFAGVHSDVGGSYEKEGTYLSNQALEWLLTEAENAGLRLEEQRRNMVLGRPFSGAHAAADLYRPPPQPDAPCLIHRSLHGPWWLLEMFPHRFYDKDQGKQRYRIPLGAPRQVPRGAIIHRSVVERMEDPSLRYAPVNLPREALHPIHTLPTTTADVSGFFRFDPTPEQLRRPQTATHKTAAAAGAAVLTALVSGGVLLTHWLLR